MTTVYQVGFTGGSDGKESACNAGDPGLIPGSGRSPGGGHVNQLQYSCLENTHGQRSLVGYSPRGCKESDTTEWLSTAHGVLGTILYSGEQADVEIVLIYVYVWGGASGWQGNQHFF